MGIRDDVITVLHDISSKDRYYEWYVTTGGAGNLARELFRYWIRDAYLPHTREYQAEFSQLEQDRLEAFTQFFESHLKDVPERFESLMTDVHWSSIAQYATVILEQMAEEGRGGEV